MHDLRGLGVSLILDWLRSGESAWLHLHGDCMRPVLPAGSRLLVATVAPAGVWPGDVIVYRTDESLACHRLIW